MARKPGDRESDGPPEGARKTQPQKLSESTASAEPSAEDRIRRRAYQIWEEEGWPHGRESDHWSRAEREIAQEAGPGPEPRAEEDRSGAVAPPKAGRRPGASAKLGGTPSAPAAGKPTRGRAK